MIGRTPSSPASNLPAARGVMVCCDRWPSRSTSSVTGLLALGMTAMEKSSQVDTVCPSTPTMRSPAFRPAFGGDGVCGHRADDDRVAIERRQLRALIQHRGHHQPGQRQVHDRAHHEHLESLPLRLRQELVRGAGAVVFGILAGHLDVAAERDRGSGSTRCRRGVNDKSFGPKPERERQHADADAARGQEMPQLVDENEHAEHEHEGKDAVSLRTPRKPLL